MILIKDVIMFFSYILVSFCSIFVISICLKPLLLALRIDLKIGKYFSNYLVFINEIIKSKLSSLIISRLNTQQKIIFYHVIFYYENLKLKVFNSSMQFMYMVLIFMAAFVYTDQKPLVYGGLVLLLLPIFVLVNSKDFVKVIILDDIFLTDVKKYHRVKLFGMKSTELIIDFNGISCLVSDRKNIENIFKISEQNSNKRLGVSGYILNKVENGKLINTGRILEAKIY